jgi:uncharacterized membrane protein YedE/YeeE
MYMSVNTLYEVSFMLFLFALYFHKIQFLHVSYLVSHFKKITYIEDVWVQSAEENVWS